EYLGRHYGTEYGKVLEIARSSREYAEVVSGDGEILAEAVFAVRNEMARSLSDIVLRRTGIATLGNPGEKILKHVAAIAARELGWDDKRTDMEYENTVRLLAVPGSEDTASRRE
ncbi:MAG TPA: glycerol-3-phosphate dehydrogenase C-terminal domain-containing protein, partial [Deltaproteobacteria bacterium]|nr:glycerol-3-phosphate dehydrogenase C-terminal domain-containing protein [Deltaproteobacteria bacterium]HQJ08027.1 glycerol-3-phosphate dehydrogenase C-terminal domain-containing protein [Deltaproteobacteria bacterium]